MEIRPKLVDKCRSCGSTLHKFVDLGMQPISNQYHIDVHDLVALVIGVCPDCKLLQTMNDIPREDIFNDHYGYITGYSPAWISEHLEFYKKIGATKDVLEIGCNDGSLLKHFENSVGVEPSRNAYLMARENGCAVLNEFFPSENIVRDFDFVIANNCLAHDPNIIPILKSIRAISHDDTQVIVEIQDAQIMLNNNQFDCFYHEHVFYYTLETLIKTFKRVGFTLHDYFKINWHGGSIRAIFKPSKPKSSRDIFIKFQQMTDFFYKGVPVPVFGAPAKFATIANYAKLSKDQVPYIIDETPFKIGQKLPGTNIPIFGLSHLEKEKPRNIVNAAWNNTEEVKKKVHSVSPETKIINLIPDIGVV